MLQRKSPRMPLEKKADPNTKDKNVAQMATKPAEGGGTRANGHVQAQGGKKLEASQATLDKFVKDYEKKHGALHPSVSVSFDPDLEAAGTTNFGGAVTIGSSAFSSAANLRSTLVHELGAHVEQIRSGNFGTSREGDLVNEIEAYRLEESSRRETGLKGSDLKDVRSEISTRLDELKKVSPEYYGRVQAGNYRLNPRDACSPSTCNLGAF